MQFYLRLIFSIKEIKYLYQYIKSIATANIANKPPSYPFILIQPEIKLAATAIKTIDKIRPKTSK